MKPQDLEKHITSTYINLRVGMSVIAFIFPLLLWLGGHLIQSLPLQGSMSAYYHSQMRDVFVGILFAIGAFLYLYKGFGDYENYALNLAGIFAIGIAVFPMDWKFVDACKTFTRGYAHGTCAVLFFICIAYVCIFRAADTLYLVKDEAKIRKYKVLYRSLGIAMVVSPIAAVVVTFVLQPQRQDKSTVFFIEVFAVWTFAAYWLFKSRELKATNAQRLALDRKIET